MKTKKQAPRKPFSTILTIALLSALAFSLRAWLPMAPAAAFTVNPNPVVDVKVPDHEFPDKALINEEFEYIARIYTEVQTPVLAGFSPYIRLILPPGITSPSATIQGVCNTPSCTDASETPVVVNYLGQFNGGNGYKLSDSTSINPKLIALNTEAPLLANQDAKLYLIESPIGSLYPSEPGVFLKVKLKLEKSAKLGVPLPVYHQPVFRFGDNAQVGPSIEGVWNAPTVTPVAALLTKRALNYPSNLAPPAPPVEAPTGSCNPLDFELIVNIADGVTLNNLQLADLFPNQLVYVANSAQGSGASGIQITDNTNATGGGTLDVLVPTDTGLPNSAPGGTRDVVIAFKAWVNNFLDVKVCEPQVIVNQATLDTTLDATFNFESVHDEAALPIAVKHVTLQKYAAGPLAPPLEKLVVPNDTVNYRLEFQVSQDLSYIGGTEISDKLPNGILYTGAALVSFNGGGPTPIFAASTTLDPGDGSTTIVFKLGNLPPCTKGRITYQGKVRQFYLPSPPVLASDKLTNFAEIKYLIGNKYGAGCKDFGAAEVLVRPINIGKEIVNPKAEYLPGEFVRFRLQMNVPSGDTQQITFKDFLPKPIFDATKATNIHLSSIACNIAGGFTPTPSALDNSLSFNFTPDPLITPTIFATVVKPCVAVEFDVQVTLDPYNDKISLTNLFQSTTENTLNEPDSHLAGVQVLVRAPKLQVTKGVYTTDNIVVNQANGLPSNQNPVNNNVTGVNAGDEVTFYITIENTGGAAAYNVKVEDFLPSELTFVSYCVVSGPAPVSVTGTAPILFAYNPLTALPPGATWKLCVKAILKTELQACQNPTNVAKAFWASHNGKSLTPVFFPPAGDTAALTTPAPTISKKPLSHAPGAQVKVGDQVLYEVTVCLPKGVMNVTVSDALPPGLTFVNAQVFNPNNIVGIPATGTTYTTAGPWPFNNVMPINFAVAGNCFSIQVRAQVNATVTDKQPLINKATVKAGLCAERTADSQEVIVSRPAVEMTKEFTPPVVSPGQTVQIQITVTNTSSTPTNVLVQDPLAAGLTALTATSSACTTVIGGQLVTSACPLAPGQTAVITITAQVAGNVNCKVIPNTATANYNGPPPGGTTASANLLVTTPDCPCTKAPETMVDWWTFDETSGNVAFDIRHDNNFAQYGAGTAAPTQTTPGFVKSALCFDGVNDYAETQLVAGNDLDFVAGESLTIDAWIRTDAATGIVGILDKRLTTAPYTGYHLFLSNGRLGVQFNGSNFFAPASTPNLADGFWHFVAVTFSRTGTLQIKLIADGLTLHTFAPTAASLGNLTNSSNLLIGRRPAALGGGYFRGCLDELEIFNRALSEAELFKLYAAGMGGKCK